MLYGSLPTWSLHQIRYEILRIHTHTLLCLRPRREGGIINCPRLSVRLSARLSVACLDIIRKRKGLRSPNLAGWKAINRVTSEHYSVQRSKGQTSKSPGRLMAVKTVIGWTDKVMWFLHIKQHQFINERLITLNVQRGKQHNMIRCF